jgi:NTP pyrophosphatase (non-canonical NTP hydrolase)
MIVTVNEWKNYIHQWAHRKGFYPNQPECLPQRKQCKHASENFAAQCCLAIGEISEAVEGDRKGDIQNRNEEIADAIIRLLDICGAYRIDIQAEMERKMRANEDRPIRHGKRY